MGWLILLLLIGILLLALARFARLDRGALLFVAAACLLALAGYAWQGSPGLAGAPRRATDQREGIESAFSATRRQLLGQFERADQWLNISEALQRQGNSRDGAVVLRSALRKHPDNMKLWIGYANALALHGGGTLNPAADLAFRRAAAIAPNHPGPRFYYGLWVAQAGDLDRAEQIWRGALAVAPASGPWRATIAQQLIALGEARQMLQDRATGR
jgi:cytochrome c-type biogenesis protein CcmH/NrfG